MYSKSKFPYLHSIMYLLIPRGAIKGITSEVRFTFHNVSINSHIRPTWKISRKQYLHSIMYLLIRTRPYKCIVRHFYLHSIMYLLILVSLDVESLKFLFTFHNVSINSFCPAATVTTLLYLHSIMYLLIPVLHNSNH